MLWQLTKSLYGATKETGKLLAEGMQQVGHGMEMLNEEMINYRYFDGDLGEALVNLNKGVRSFYYIPTKYFDVYYKQYLHGVPTIHFCKDNYGKQEIYFDFQVDGESFYACISRSSSEKEYDSLMTFKGNYSYKMKLDRLRADLRA